MARTTVECLYSTKGGFIELNSSTQEQSCRELLRHWNNTQQLLTLSKLRMPRATRGNTVDLSECHVDTHSVLPTVTTGQRAINLIWLRESARRRQGASSGLQL